MQIGAIRRKAGDPMTRLEHERLGKRWTVDDLADESGVSRSTIHRLERGHSYGQRRTLFALAAALELSSAQSVSLTDPAYAVVG